MAQAKADVQAEFAEALHRAGLRPKGIPIMDGRKHRVPVEGDRSGRKSGTYIGHLDERPAGYIHNFKTGEEIRWKSAREYPALAPAERKRLKARIAAEQTTRESERSRREARAAHKALAVWNHARSVESHPYLTRKGVAAHGLRQTRDGNLIVPMRDANGTLWGIQTIDAAGNKLFMRDARKQGLQVAIGTPGPGEPVVIAEGFATAATLREATGLAIIAAFDSGNLLDVARAIHERDPDRPIIFAADNDHHLPALATPLPNVGTVKAREAAKAVGGIVLSPPFASGDPGTDWNDYAAQHGKEAMRALAQVELRSRGIELPSLAGSASSREDAVTQSDRDAARQRLRAGPRALMKSAAHVAARVTARQAARQRQSRGLS
jgi:phage/plasmid primase-like uncharacterized protein